jgi:hypothetical protein
VTEDEVVRILSELPGVVVVTASQANGAPEVAWGDSFFYYEPDDSAAVDRRLPFATIVTKDYEGFDTSSNLNRPGVFRLNLAVGRRRFEELFGFPPAEFGAHEREFDFALLDRLMPHPVYAIQGWVSVLVPGAETAAQMLRLIGDAYQRARSRYRPRR